MWEDLKDIKPPMYDGNPLNLDNFLEKLDDWGVTVTEDMDPADAEKYVFRRFRYRLPEVLQELYLVATKEGKIKRAPAGIREAKVEMDKDELSKLMSQGTELAKEIQEIKRNWVPRSDNKDKDKKPRNRRKNGVNEVDAE